MEEFSELQNRIDRLQHSIDVSEAEEVILVQENEMLKNELAIEEEAECRRRLTFLQVQQLCTDYELTTVKRQEHLARLKREILNLEAKFANLSVHSITSQMENCVQHRELRLDEISFHVEERSVFERWLKQKHASALTKLENADEEDVMCKQKMDQVQSQSREIEDRVTAAKKELEKMCCTEREHSSLATLKEEWERLSCLIQQSKNHLVDIGKRQVLADKQLHEEEKQNHDLEESLEKLKRNYKINTKKKSAISYANASGNSSKAPGESDRPSLWS